MVENNKKEQGKKNRAAGGRFELKVREKMEAMGWRVSKWMNTVEQEKDGGIWKLAPVKRKFNPFAKALVIGTGFPDFVCFKKSGVGEDVLYDVIGLEVKSNGYLDQKEKSMCRWLIDNGVFSRILIAKKGKKKGEVEYFDFKEKYKEK